MRVRHLFTRRVPFPRSPHLASDGRAAPGQVMIIFAMAALVLVGFVALAVDTGFLMAEKRQTQSAADAAALAGAKALFDGKTGQIVSDAKAYGAENAGVSEGDVIVSWPPASGEFADVPDKLKYVQVTINKEVDKFFLGAVYSGDDWEVGASAVAGVELVPSDYGLIALGEPGIQLTGTADISITNGGSAMSNADIGRNGASNIFVTAGTIDANGTIDEGPSWSAPDGIRDGQPTVPDPIKAAGISAPSRPAVLGVTDCGGSPPRNCTMSHGLYQNQTVDISRTATMGAGVYYFDNADVVLGGNNAHLIGDDVLMYFTNGSTLSITPGSVDLVGHSSFSKIAIWVEDDTAFDAGGNSDLFVEGIIYAPEASVTLRGTGSDVVHGQVFVHDLEIVGTGDMGIRYVKTVDTSRPKVFLVS
jgi:hypothetical protein